MGCGVVLLMCATAWLSLSGGGNDQQRLTIAESLLSEDGREGVVAKIDSRGFFQRDEGVTIVMPANLSLNTDVYLQAYDLIYTRFRSILSPLPVDSYHITLSSIASRDKATLTEYYQLLTDNRGRLESVKWQLSTDALQQQRCLTFYVADVRFGPVAVSLAMRPKTAVDEAEVQRLNALMDRSLGPTFQRQPRWHLTVAYRRYGLTIEPAQTEQVQAALMEVFKGVDVFVLPPVLCAFYDMRQFRPV